MNHPSEQNEPAPLYQEALATFRALLEQAKASADPEPTAMTLATSQGDRVSARIVLLKGVDAGGFRFFTNYESEKAHQLAAHAQAALCFHWKGLPGGVQVRVEGRVEKLPAAESDAYFATRERGSRIGAWASLQSRPLKDRAEFEARLLKVEQRYASADVPRPPHWGGFLVVPDRIEFWYGADFRLHERVQYSASGSTWTRQLLYP